MKPGFRVSLETGFHVPEAPYFKGFQGLVEVHAFLTQSYRVRRTVCIIEVGERSIWFISQATFTATILRLSISIIALVANRHNSILAQTPIHGSYHPFADKMLSYDSNALAPDEFRKWILPPEDVCEMNDDIIVGDGYVIPLDEPGAAEDLDNPKVLDRAIKYCKEGAIGYVTIRDGIGKAFVEGTKWYEVDFELRNGYITEAYCGCPYPGLCKHLLAVAITLSIMSKKGDLDLNRDVTLIDATRFWKMIQHMGQSVTI